MVGQACTVLVVGNKILTVEAVLKDHPFGHMNVVCQDRWSLVTGSVILKCRSFCRKCIVCQDRWSRMAVVFQDRFHCILSLNVLVHKYNQVIYKYAAASICI